MKKKFVTLALALSFLLGLSSCSSHLVEGAGEDLEILSLDDIKTFNETNNRPVIVEFWHAFGNALTIQTNEIIQRFEADMLREHGIRIQINGSSRGGTVEALREQINMGIRTRNLPTLTAGMPGHFIDNMTLGIHVPLDGFANSSDANIGLIGDYNYKDIIPAFWNEGIMTYGNETALIGMPFAKSSEVMFYNSDIVIPLIEGYIANALPIETHSIASLKTNANISTDTVLFTSENLKVSQDSAGGPSVTRWVGATWQQVWFVSEYVRQNNQALVNQGLISSGLTHPTLIDSQSNFVVTGMYQWTGNSLTTTKEDGTAGEFRMDTAENEAAMNYFFNHREAGRWDFPADFGSASFVAQNTVISIGSTAGGDRLLSSDFTTGVTNRPQQPNGRSAEYNMSVQQGPNLSVLHSNSNNLTRLAAWLFMRYVSSAEITAVWSASTGYLPVRTSAIENDLFHDFTHNFHDNTVIPRITLAAFEQSDTFRVDPVFPGSPSIRSFLEPIFVQHMFFFKDGFTLSVDHMNRRVEDLRLGLNIIRR